MQRRYAVFTTSRTETEVVICPVVEFPEPTTEALPEGPLVIMTPVVRFTCDLAEVAGPVTVTFRDAPTDDDRYGDAPWVAPEVERPIRAIVRDAVTAVFGVTVADRTPSSLHAAA